MVLLRIKHQSKYQIINVFRLLSGLFNPVRSGAGGNRTLVQTRKSYAFYMLIFAFGFRAQARPKPPTSALSSKNFAYDARPSTAISEFAAPPYRRASETERSGDVSFQHLVPK